ncbi:MAG TPA: glycoside hydrolase family 3 N-terminal domain-containing protein, partial [Flavobacterium sp.]|nr:glycoside hydrolase family 3 N-terminal domain-containing protein [Flavobacterium sp.]
GIHFMFAPVVDININPKNPVIGNRSFGEDKENVAKKAVALMKGMQNNGIYATAKHFPGHGDTATDSHHSLPLIDFDRKRLNAVELYPYRSLISQGLSSVMVAHLEVPALESQKGVPSSLSYKTITELLKNEMKFEGLIFTDALNMKGASNFKSPGEIDLAAFQAGNDVLLFAEDVPKAIEKFNQAFENGEFTEERLAYSVKKILKYKYEVGLNKFQEISTKNLSKDLNDASFDDLSFELYKNIVTVLQNKKHFLPLKSNDRIAYVTLGDDVNKDFQTALERYGLITVFSQNDVEDYIDDLKQFDQIIIGYHKADGAWKKHDMNFQEIALIDKIAAIKPSVLVSFTKPYALTNLKNVNQLNSIVLGFQNNKFAFEAVSNALFGYADVSGKTPVSIGKHFSEGDGISLKASANFQQSVPGLEGVDANQLKKIDDLGNKVVNQKLAPGAQVLVLKDGKVIYDKTFGTLDYDNKQPVNQQTVYDLASLSKILGTLPVVMKMYDEGKIRFEDKLGDLLPEFKKSDKANITVKELLTHQSGFTAWIPFYKTTLDENGMPSSDLYQKTYSKEFSIQVCENLYLKTDYKKEIINQIKESKLGAKKYVYSDLNFMLLQQIAERKYDEPLDVLLEKYFIEPMNLTNLTYNPLTKMDSSRIAPTEIDDYYRHTKINGYVHDMGGAMCGGVAGHAGLFGNAYDVAQMMQLFLDGGVYQGKQLLSKKTLEAFNTCYFCSSGNRRGAGFDKPQLGTSGPTCGCASKNSFGHTGFTGTMAWADPDNKIVYVFLSNRTYPNATDNKLSKANVREDIQQIIYDSIIH